MKHTATLSSTLLLQIIFSCKVFRVNRLSAKYIYIQNAIEASKTISFSKSSKLPSFQQHHLLTVDVYQIEETRM